jgi:hypothetical protein
LDCLYYIPNKIIKLFTGVNLSKDGGVDGSTTPKEPLHLGPGPVEDYMSLINYSSDP